MKHLGLALSRTAALGLGLALAVPPLAAQEAPALVPKPARELATTSAGVTETGVANLNLGVQSGYGWDGSEARRFPSQLALGVLPWLDLRVAWSGPTALRDADGVRQSGPGDPLVGGQVQALFQDRAGLDLGLAYWHKLPRASVQKGIGTGKADDTLVLAASRTAGSWEVDLNAGATWLGRPEGDGRVRQGIASLAVTRAFAPGWSASLEASAQAGTELGPRSAASILAVSRDLTPNLTADVGVEAGLTRSAQRLAVHAGVVWRLGRLWGR
jgi:hypothetical protein